MAEGGVGALSDTQLLQMLGAPSAAGGADTGGDVSQLSDADLLGHINKAKAEEVNLDTTLRQMVRGIPVGGPLVNKAAAALDALTYPILGRGSSKGTYSERYGENIGGEEAKDVTYEQAHPALSTGLQIAGAGAAAIPFGGTTIGGTMLGVRGANLGSRIAGGTLGGGLLSGGDAAMRGGDIGTGALTGALVGGALPGVAQGLGAAARGVRGALARTPTESLPANLETIGGVPLARTTGQMTGDAATQGFERNAARGLEGEMAQKTVAQPFFEQQQANVGRATEGIQAGMGGGTVHAQTPYEAGAIIGPSVQAEKTAAQAAVDKLYEPVRANPAIIPADRFTYVARRVKADLTVGADPVDVSPKTTPTASKMLDDLDRWGGVPRNKADFMAATKAPGSTMADIDQFRKGLLATKRTALPGTEDGRAAGRIIQSFDKQIDMIAPSPELAAARAAHAEYRQTFFQNGPRDDIGRAMEKIVGGKGAQPAAPGEVADLLYGSPKGNSPRLIERMKQVFGENSEQFAAVKQGYLSRIMESPQGTPWESGMLAKRLTDAIDPKGNGYQLSQAIFSQAERLELQQLRNYLRDITAKPTAGVNYSGTAAPLLRRIGGLLTGRTSAALMGLHLGGPVGGVIGLAAQPAQQAIAARLATRRVAQSIYGKPPTPGISPAAAQALRNISLLPPVIAPQLNAPSPPVY